MVDIVRHWSWNHERDYSIQRLRSHEAFSYEYSLSLGEYFHPIVLIESQVILHHITGFKSKNIFKCAFKAKLTRKAQCAWCVWRACVSKALPQTGNTVRYYLFDYGNTENINSNIITWLSCSSINVVIGNRKVIHFCEENRFIFRFLS